MPFEDFSVERLINRIPPALQYLWVVDVQIPGDSLTDTRDMTLLARTAQIPGFTNGEITVPYMNSEFYIAGKRTWETMDITFMEDERGIITRSFYNWANLIYNVEGYGEGGVPKDYKSRIDVTLLTRKGEGIATWLMYGCWPTTIGNTEVSYTAEEVLEIPVTFRYDYWTRSAIAGRIKEFGLPTGGRLDLPGVGII